MDFIETINRAFNIKEIITPLRIKTIRRGYKLSQEDFAKLLGVKYHTYKNWEIGHRRPSSPGRALLLIAEKSPEIFLKQREKIIEYTINRGNT